MWSFLKTWWSGLFEQDLRPAPRSARDPDTNAIADEAIAAAATPAADAASAQPSPTDWWVVPDETGEARRPPEDVLVDRELFGQLTRVLDDPALELPRLPDVARDALNSLRDAQVDYRKLAECVGRDPAVAAEVLKVANSVLHRRLHEVRDLEAAFTRLGQRTIRSVILGVSFKGLVIRTGGPQRTIGEELWRGSTAAAVLMRELCDFGTLRSEEAFLLGLLHDLGSLVILKVVYDFQQCHGRTVSRAAFDRLCEQWHQHVGMRMATNWNLPDPLPALIGSHHAAPAADDPYRRDRLLLQLVDGACVLLGCAKGPRRGLLTLPAAEELGWAARPNIRARLERLPEQVREALAADAPGTPASTTQT